MSESLWTKPNRPARVVSTHVRECIVGENLTPSAKLLQQRGIVGEGVSDGDKIWLLETHYVVGMGQKNIHFVYFASVHGALLAQQNIEKAVESSAGHRFPFKLREFLGGFEENYTFRSSDAQVFSENRDNFDGQLYEILYEAGVLDEQFSTAPRVVEAVGEDDCQWMRAVFGECWQYVAQLDYCLQQFAFSSFATMAARINFNRWVVDDQFSAGYLQREMELILSGAEDIALAELDLRRRRSKISSAKNTEKKVRRLNLLMAEIEKLSSVVGLMDEEAIFQQAWKNAARKSPDMPKTKKIREEYGTALRSEEPYKTRYFRMFSVKNA